MYRSHSLLSIAFCLYLFLCSEPARAEERQTIAESTESYYPLHEGNTWHFDLEVGQAREEMTYVVAKKEKIDSETLFRIDTIVGGNTQATEHLKNSPSGLFRYHYNGIEMVPPVQLLKSPIQVGQTWSSQLKVGSQEITVDVKIERQERVSVPAGEFDAILCHVATEVEGTTVISDYWFAADVGIVKQEIQLGKEEIISKLREYKLVASDEK